MLAGGPSNGAEAEAGATAEAGVDGPEPAAPPASPPGPPPEGAELPLGSIVGGVIAARLRDPRVVAALLLALALVFLRRRRRH